MEWSSLQPFVYGADSRCLNNFSVQGTSSGLITHISLSLNYGCRRGGNVYGTQAQPWQKYIPGTSIPALQHLVAFVFYSATFHSKYDTGRAKIHCPGKMVRSIHCDKFLYQISCRREYLSLSSNGTCIQPVPASVEVGQRLEDLTLQWIFD